MKSIDERFSDMYGRITKIAHKFANTTPIPYEEYESYLCEEFIKIDKSFRHEENANYAAYVGTMLNAKAKTLASNGGSSKMRRFYDSVQPLISYDDDDDDGVSHRTPIEMVAEDNVEETVYDILFVEEQLAKADGDTRRILKEFFTNPDASFREIARNLNLHREYVKRRLEAVAETVVRDV